MKNKYLFTIITLEWINFSLEREGEEIKTDVQAKKNT